MNRTIAVFLGLMVLLAHALAIHGDGAGGLAPIYELLDEKGPDHSKCFEICVVLAGKRFRSAWGPNKKEAEQKAALNALHELEVVAVKEA